MLHRRAAHCLLTAGLPVCFRLTGRHTGLPLQRVTARLLVACHSSADGLPVCFRLTGRHTVLPLQRATARLLVACHSSADGLPACFRLTGRHMGLPLQRVTACLLVTCHSSACDSSAREPQSLAAHLCFLHVVQPFVVSVHGEQLVVRAALHDAPLVHYADFVGRLDG